MKAVKNFLTCCIFLAIPLFCCSQNYWEITVSPGVSVYYGDLTVPIVTFKESHLAGQMSIKRYFNGEHALRFNVLHGSLSGDDKNYTRNSVRGNSFVGRITEFAMMGEIDLNGKRRYTKKIGYQKTKSPYVMFGVSGIYSKPKVNYGQPDSKDKNIDYPKWHFGMPVGAGFKFDATERMVFGVELGLRLTLSDYLDGTQASGNAYKNDAFFFFGLTANYRFQVQKSVLKKPKENA